MNDLLFMLTATLKLAPIIPSNTQDSDLDPNELTNSSNDSDRTVVDNGYNHLSSSEESTIYRYFKTKINVCISFLIISSKIMVTR